MSWWQRIFHARRLEDELDRELEYHLDQHAADLIARGMGAEEARRKARLALGGPEQVKEQCRDARGARWLDDLWQDTRHTFRTMRQRPGFATLAILTLALGTGATSVMFTLVNSVLLRPLAYPEPENLVTLHIRTDKIGETWGFSNPDYRDFQRESRSLASVAAWTYGGGVVSKPGEAEYLSGRQISAELFSVLGIAPVQGRAFLPEEDQPGAAPVAMISYALWQRRFGGRPSIIGTPLDFDGKSSTIVGVTPEGFSLDGDADVFSPLGQFREARMQNRAARFLHVVARLRTGITMAEAQSEVAVIANRLAKSYPASNANLTVTARPLSQELTANVQPTLWMLFGAVSVLLLIACVNVASLLLARAVSRERELAMRAALGAGRRRMIQQCLTESTVLALFGGLAGVLLAWFGTAPFVALWPGGLPRSQEIHVDWRVLLVALGASVGSGLMFGLAPALRQHSDNLEQILRAGAHHLTGRSRRLQSGLVACEIALAIVLLITAGVLAQTMLELASLNPGVDASHVLTARVALSPAVLTNPAQIRASWDQFINRARSVPGVRFVALADIIPMRTGENVLYYSTTAVPPPPNQAPLALASTVTSDYLRVMGIPLLDGRFFTDDDRAGTTRVIVIDENLARDAFGEVRASGKELWSNAMGPDPLLVIGVVGHVRHWGLAGDDHSRVRDQLYYPFAQVPDQLLHFFSSVMSVAVWTQSEPLNPVEAIRREEHQNATLYEVRTMQQLVKGSLDRQRFLVQLFGGFAALALLLACIGLYGVLAYLTRERVREFGLRMALGATAGGVVRLVLRQTLGMIATGAVVGILGGLAVARVLMRLVKGMRPAAPATFIATVSVLTIAALAASFLPAHRASRVDPLKALREE